MAERRRGRAFPRRQSDGIRRSPGIRDRGAIESAPARHLAAALSARLCQNRGFIDCNKRTAFLTTIAA
jgi:prophage maintenance system killer protein